MTEKQPDIFVVARYHDNGSGAVIGAFLSLNEARAFSDQSVASCRTPHEVEITRCTPTPQETWRRFARPWSSDAWEHMESGDRGIWGKR